MKTKNILTMLLLVLMTLTTNAQRINLNVGNSKSSAATGSSTEMLNYKIQLSP